MKKSTVLRILQRSTDVIDGPGWTDADVNGYYDNDGKYMVPQSNNQ